MGGKQPKAGSAGRSVGPVQRGSAVLAVVALLASGLVLATGDDAQAAPATPVATITAPTNGFLGEGFDLVVAFDNTDVTDPGYGPYLDVVIPNAGADGAGAALDDGLTSGPPTYLGSPVPTTTIVCTGAAVTHPLTGLSVPCPAGTSLLVVELPFGSFTPGQPPAAVTIPISVSSFADLGVGLGIQATAGFRFGATPVDDAATDPPIVQSPPTAHTYTPDRVMDVRKVYLGPEDETATGPNFPRQYRLETRIADGQTITELVITDDLAKNLAYLQTDATSPGGATLVDEPAVGVAANPPDNVLRTSWTSVTEAGGVGAYDDASMLFSWFVPRLDADGKPVIDAATGDDVTAENQARATGSWLPLDPRDRAGGPVAIVDDAPGPEHVLTPKSIATQKSVALTKDPGGNGTSPGDTLTWTVQFQVSDFFTFDQVVVNDLLGDGQTYVGGSAALTVTDERTTRAGTFEPANHTVDTSARTKCGDGKTAITFDVSGAMGTLSGDPPTDDGVIAGGYALNPAGNSGAATGTITFESVISQDYACAPPADKSVDERDFVANDVTIDGRILDNESRIPTGSREEDGSGASAAIAEGGIAKTLYARNGTLCSTSPSTCATFQVGDDITWRLERSLPTSDFEDLTLVDFLPLPVLPVPGSLTLDATPVDATPPATGKAKYGSGDTFHALGGAPPPTVTTDAIDNTVSFDYGTFDTDPDQKRQIDLLFTLTIDDEPFADKLQLTNQLRERSENSFGAPTVVDALRQLTLGAPNVRIDKGVVATDATGATFTPGTVGPVPFTSPGGSGTRFTGKISSAALDTTPINSNLAGIEAGDRVTFAIVAQNRGSAPDGAFDVRLRDTLPTGFAIPSGGLNLSVTDGTGGVLLTSAVNGGDAEPLFGHGIELDDPSASTGSLGPYDAQATPPVNTTSGKNLVVLTYDLVAVEAPAADALRPGQVLTNTVTLFNFAAQEDGTDFTIADRSDNALVTGRKTTVGKTVVGTSAAHTVGNDVVIGEQVTYEVIVTVPQGSSPAVTLVDKLDNGLAFVSFDSISASGGLSTTATGGFDGVKARVAVSNGGRDATFDFGDVENAADDGDPESITLRYTVAVRNAIANQNGNQRNNAATWSWDDAGGAPVGTATGSAPNVTIREPALTVTKVANPATADAGDTVTYTITVANPSSSPVDAFNVTLDDVVPAGLTYKNGTLVHTSGLAPTTGPDAGGAPTLTASWDSFPRLSTSTFTYQVVVAGGAGATDSYQNTAKVRWTSLPGSPTSQSPYVDDDLERTGVDGPGGALNDYGVNGQATVQIANPKIQKAFVESSEPSTTGQDLTIGETATYDLVVALPEGQVPGVNVVDRVPAGMQVVANSATVITAAGSGANQSPSLTADFAGTLTSPTVTGGTGDGTDLTVGFPATVAVTANNDTTDDAFVVRLTLRVLDVAGNDGVAPGRTTLVNDATVQIIGGTLVASNQVSSLVAEPAMAIAKTVAPNPVLGGQQVTVTLTVTNNGTSRAFDANVEDVLDGSYSETTAAGSSTACGFAFGRAGSTISYTGGTVSVGQSCTLVFTADVDGGLVAGTVVPNTATVTKATTLPGTVNGERDEPDVSGSASLNVVTPDLVVTKSDGLTVTTPGKDVIYTITVANVGGATAPKATLTDPIPANMTFVSCSDGCVESPAGTMTWGLGDVPAGAPSLVRTITLRVEDPLPSGVTTVSNTASASDTGANGPDPSPDNNTATDTDSVTAAPDLAITKTDGQATVVPGQPLTYELTITNNGDQGATGVLVRDTLPSGVTFTGCSNDCVSSALPVVTWPTFGLAGGGASVTRSVTVTVDTPAAADLEEIVNGATVVDDGANGPDPDLSDNEATDTDTLDAAPDLVIAKTDGFERLEGGDSTTYVITVGNVGTEDAGGVVVTDTLPTGVTFDSCTNGCDSSALPVVTWHLGTLGAGDARDLRVKVTVTDPVLDGTTEFVNVVTVTDTDPEPDPTPKDTTATDVDTYGADLSVTKTDGSDTATPGKAVTYTVVVTNGGPSRVTDFTLTETLPSELTGATFAASAGSFESSSRAWSGLDLGPGDSVTLTVSGTVDPAASGPLVNAVRVALPGGFTDPTPDNDSAQDIDELVPEAELTVTKRVVGAVVAGGTATYEVVVKNLGPSVSRDAKIVDTMPAGLEPVSATGQGWTCAITGQVVECTHGDPIDVDASTTVKLEAHVTAAPGTNVENSVTASGTGYPAGGESGKAVAGATVTSPSQGALAFTGRNLLGLAALGLAMAVAGVVGVGIARRRRGAMRSA